MCTFASLLNAGAYAKEILDASIKDIFEGTDEIIKTKDTNY